MAFGNLMWLLVWLFFIPSPALKRFWNAAISRFPGTWAELLDRNAAQYKTVSWWHRSHQRRSDVAVNMVWIFCGVFSWVETMMRFMDTWCVSHSRDGRFTSITEDLFEKIAAECLNLCSKTNGMSNDDLGKTNFDEVHVKQAGYQRGTIPLHGFEFDRSLQ